jgi:hypothetical protein
MLDPYGPELDGTTLDKLNISSFRNYAIETKASDQNFAEYSADDIYVHAVQYTEGLTTFDEDSMPSVNVQVKLSQPFRDFVKAIGSTLKKAVTPDKARLFKRKRGTTFQETTFESLLLEENMDKKAEELGLYNGNYVYIETIDSEEDLKRSKWITALEAEKNKIRINFNNPYQSGDESGCILFNYQVEAPKTMLLRDAKQLIANKLNIKPSEFIMKRGGSCSPELKELDQTLGSIGLLRSSTIFIEFGVPTKASECKLAISKAVLSPNLDEDTESHVFSEETKLHIDSDATVLQVKDAIAQKLAPMLAPTRIRLREVSNGKLAKVCMDLLDMKYYGLYDGKLIAYQILEEDEMFGVSDVALVVREWDPTTWTLSERKELTIKRSWRMHDLSYAICDLFPHFRSKISTLSAAKVTSLWSFKRGDLLGAMATPSLLSLSGTPFTRT